MISILKSKKYNHVKKEKQVSTAEMLKCRIIINTLEKLCSERVYIRLMIIDMNSEYSVLLSWHCHCENKHLNKTICLFT
jgi:hypothetical protein